MPSPFPGMDPFLEHPDLFSGIHDRLVYNVSDQLQAILPAPYYAEMAQRVWVEVSERLIEPDVDVLRRANRPAEPLAGSGGVALASSPRTAPIVVHVPHDEIRERFINIFSRFDDAERVVTAIEILSFTNKSTGGQGRELYVRKQQEAVEGKTHLVEIDLLRGGQHTTAVPLDRLRHEAGVFDYHVCVHRFDNFEDYFVYPIPLEQRLPIISVPLLPDDGAVALDLQLAFDRAYDSGPYRRRVSYDRAVPPPALRPEQTVWVAERLRAAGLNPAP